MRAHEFITEFGFSSESPKARITQEEIESANIVGRIDGRDICELSNNEVSLFFFKNETHTLTTYAVVSKQSSSDGYFRLHRIFNEEPKKGVLTALVMGIILNLRMKLCIATDEGLTFNGINWICKLISAGGRGIKIVDQTGNRPNPSDLMHLWNRSFDTGEFNDTEIFLENIDIKLHIHESKLLPPLHYYIGDERLI